MITDAQARLSSAQALTTGTQYSTNSYDLVTARDVGRGGTIRAVVTVDTSFAGGTSETINLVESANADLSSPTVLGAVTVLEAALLAGSKIFDRALPQTSKRYLGFQYVASGTHSAGALSAWLLLDSDSGTVFPGNTGY